MTEVTLDELREAFETAIHDTIVANRPHGSSVSHCHPSTVTALRMARSVCNQRNDLELRVAELEARCERRLYRYEDGAAYWVTARSEAEAIGLVILVNSYTAKGEEFASCDASLDDGYQVREVSREECGDMTYYDDGKGCERPLWAAHIEMTEPQVISCSEWP